MQKHAQIDWPLIVALLVLVGAGLVTMYSCTGQSYYFSRQIIWTSFGFAVFLGASLIDWRFLRRGEILVGLYLAAIGLLLLLTVIGATVRGAQSWFELGGFSLQPADFVKVLLVLVLAKYFSRRHVAIASPRHIIISGLYAAVPFLLILMQPDFGSAVIIASIWLGLALIAGISKKHLFLLFGAGLVGVFSLWFFVFTPIQKARVTSFLNPLADVRGAGYNAFQSMVAVGSGQWFGKGVCYGTQSRLSFLPEYQTDFIFAAFSEEWGLVGVFFLFSAFGYIFYYILRAAYVAESNFESLYGLGVAIFLAAHVTIHIGMNVGLLPVTGLPLPLVSYGGSHIVVEFLSLGILSGMRRYERAAHRESARQEFFSLS
jgi:rod shape determining protein RodA